MNDCCAVVVATLVADWTGIALVVIAFEKRGCVGAANKPDVVWGVVLSDKSDGVLVDAVAIVAGWPKLNEGGAVVAWGIGCCWELPKESVDGCGVPKVGGTVAWTVGCTAWTFEAIPKPNDGALVDWGVEAPKANPLVAGLAIDGIAVAPKENPVELALKMF